MRTAFLLGTANPRQVVVDAQLTGPPGVDTEDFVNCGNSKILRLDLKVNELDMDDLSELVPGQWSTHDDSVAEGARDFLDPGGGY
ncbi:MAG: hypothetical protein JWO62_96 [Acidimicrobiaceae bacterium]|nr:hypothetical protein [Acidimicrobiaceae bacterium]